MDDLLFLNNADALSEKKFRFHAGTVPVTVQYLQELLREDNSKAVSSEKEPVLKSIFTEKEPSDMAIIPGDYSISGGPACFCRYFF